jgi:hypothetical protein
MLSLPRIERMRNPASLVDEGQIYYKAIVYEIGLSPRK